MIERVSVPALSGKVTDALTSKPIKGANVQIAGHPDTIVTTGERGDFTTRPAEIRRFTFSPSGNKLREFRLRTWSEGYFSERRKNYIPSMVDSRLSVGWIPLSPKIKRSPVDRRRTVDQFAFLEVGMPLTTVKDRVGWPDFQIRGLGGWGYKLADGSDIIIAIMRAQKPPYSYETWRIAWLGQSRNNEWLWRTPFDLAQAGQKPNKEVQPTPLRVVPDL